jgi:uncharacterized protein
MPTRDDPWPPGTPCWTDLAVPDVRAATDFYGPVFGWSFVDSGAQFGHYHIARTRDRAAAAIGSLQQEGQPSAWTVYLASDDADATAKLVGAAGGSVLIDPFDIPGNGRMLVGLDPCGASFGVWQAAGQIGIEIYAEPGSLVWAEARLTDLAAGRRFYAAVFGHTFQPSPGMPGDYETFQVGGQTAGGMGGKVGPAGMPAHWLPYFSVPDVDAAVSTTEHGGGAVVTVPQDTPFGRMAVLIDPFGAAFAVHREPSEEQQGT